MEIEALRPPTPSPRPLAGHERHTALQQLAAVRSSRDRPGAAVGLLDVPAKGRNRVSTGTRTLLQNEQVVRYADWLTGKKLAPMREPLDEAGRCAELILQRWPGDN